MIASFDRPIRQVALVLSIVSLLLLVAAGTVALSWPFPYAQWLFLPFLALGCSICASLVRVDLSRSRLEAPFLIAVFLTLGPMWAIGASVLGWIAASFIRHGSLPQRGSWQNQSAFGLAVVGMLGLQSVFQLPYAAQAALCALLWFLIGPNLSPSVKSTPLQTFSIFFVSAAAGGLLDVRLGIWIVLILIPTALLASIAVYQAHTESQHRETLQALALMLQRAHPYTHAHIERVASLAERTALKLGLSPDRARLIHDAARLHDIGKIAIDEGVLDKPGGLTPEEYEHVKLHAPLGAAIVEEVHELRGIAEWIRHHHERPDGQGYPHGLAGDEIPLEARIIAVADAFDAMTGGFEGGEKRAYREPMSPPEALEEMRRCAGTQFDVAVVRAFDEAFREETLPC